jgi:myo-inositol-1(or 4)-monophosphatase
MTTQFSSSYGAFANKLILEAGQIMLSHFSFHTSSRLKSDFTSVTAVDEQINALFIKEIRKEFPHHGIIGEEESLCRGDEEFIWYADPLDGTNSFLSGSTTCATTLSLTRNGESVLGITYDPFYHRVFFAEKGKGASLNGFPIHVSKNGLQPGSVCGIVTWDEHPFDPLPLMAKIIRRKMHLPNYGSTALMAALVANGGFTATIYMDDKLWDTAAGDILVTEAGGRVTDLLGRPIKYDPEISPRGCLFSNGVVHNDLLQLAKETIPSLG